MKHLLQWGMPLLVLALSPLLQAQSTALNVASAKTLKIDRGLSEDGRACITCHQQTTPGQVADWKGSRHARRGSISGGGDPGSRRVWWDGGLREPDRD